MKDPYEILYQTGIILIKQLMDNKTSNEISEREHILINALLLLAGEKGNCISLDGMDKIKNAVEQAKKEGKPVSQHIYNFLFLE